MRDVLKLQTESASGAEGAWHPLPPLGRVRRGLGVASLASGESRALGTRVDGRGRLVGQEGGEGLLYLEAESRPQTAKGAVFLGAGGRPAVCPDPHTNSRSQESWGDGTEPETL